MHESLYTHMKPPTRKARLETYFWDTGGVGSGNIINSFRDPKLPLASTVVAIPVAAGQEFSALAPSIDAYASQKKCEPFSVALLLNFRRGISGDEFAKAEATVAEAERLKRDYEGQVDIRLAVHQFNAPTIGKIRKALWDTLAFLAYCEGKLEDEHDEVLVVNHDIDTVQITPHYIGNIQSTYANLQQQLEQGGNHREALPLRYTHVRHHLPFKTHPNTARGIKWKDRTIDNAIPYVGYEEGLVVPLTHYALSGGFSPDAKTHETRPFFPKHAHKIPTIPGTRMLTSPRRYIDRFPNHGFEDTWTTDSFGDNDSCRDDAPKRDATAEELAFHVEYSLPEQLLYYYMSPALHNAVEDIWTEASAAQAEGLVKSLLDKKSTEIDRVLGRAYGTARQVLRSVQLEHLLHDNEHSMPAKEAKSSTMGYIREIIRSVRLSAPAN